MAIISDIQPYIRRIVKNCPDLTIDFYTREILRDFCQKTWLYQKTYDLQPASGQEVYPLQFIGDDEVIAVKGVMYNNRPIYAGRPEDLRTSATGNDPYSWFFEPPDVLVLRPTPNDIVNDTCTVRLVLQPSLDSDSFPEVIYQQYRETIAAGVLARLLLIPNEVWFNPDLSNYYKQTYAQGASRAKAERMFGHMPSNTRVRQRSFLAN